MINVLRLEFFRLKKSKLFWILLGVTAVLPIITALVSSVILSIIDAVTSSGAGMGNLAEQFRSSVTTSILSSLGMVGYGATLLPLITASVVLSKEFADGTMRNAILANKKTLRIVFFVPYYSVNGRSNVYAGIYNYVAGNNSSYLRLWRFDCGASRIRSVLLVGAGTAVGNLCAKLRMYVFVCNAQAMGYNTVSHTYYVIGAGYYEYGDNHHNHCIGAARRRAVLHGYKLGTLLQRHDLRRGRNRRRACGQNSVVLFAVYGGIYRFGILLL